MTTKKPADKPAVEKEAPKMTKLARVSCKGCHSYTTADGTVMRKGQETIMSASAARALESNGRLDVEYYEVARPKKKKAATAE